MTLEVMTSSSSDDFEVLLERARASGGVEVDLAEPDPARCGLLLPEATELFAIAASRVADHRSSAAGLTEAREGVASYLAGLGGSVEPENVFFAPSRDAAVRLSIEGVCQKRREVLVPFPALPETPGLQRALGERRYELTFDGGWRLDPRSLRRSLTSMTGAVEVGNPAQPTGAMVSKTDLAFLDGLCAEREMALVGEETFFDTALDERVSVSTAKQCLALHVSGVLGGLGGNRLCPAWIAVTGPATLVEPAASRLKKLMSEEPPVAGELLFALPAVLARRESYLEALCDRLANNRAAVATASLREAPWTLQWGSGGIWAVLQVNPVVDVHALCAALLTEGVAVLPGRSAGLPQEGFLVVSLLPEPGLFSRGLRRLEARLRAM